jgi:hypothetical protein
LANFFLTIRDGKKSGSGINIPDVHNPAKTLGWVIKKRDFAHPVLISVLFRCIWKLRRLSPTGSTTFTAANPGIAFEAAKLIQMLMVFLNTLLALVHCRGIAESSETPSETDAVRVTNVQKVLCSKILPQSGPSTF